MPFCMNYSCNSCKLFLAEVKFTSLSYAVSAFSLPLVSLFSINSSQSLCKPCYNWGERANKTLFILTLIPIDPIVQ